MPALFTNVGVTGTAIAAAALTISGYAPAVSTSVEISTPVGAITATGHAPTLAQTGQMPAGPMLVFGLNLWSDGLGVSSGTLSLIGYIPTLDNTTGAESVGDDDLLSGLAIVAGTGAKVLPTSLIPVPTSGAFTAAGYAPGLSWGVAVPAASLATTGYAAGLDLSALLPGTGTLTVTGHAPTPSALVSIPVGAGAFAGYVPGKLFLETQERQPPAGTATITGYAPLAAFDSYAIAVGAGSGTWTGYAPAFSEAFTIAVPVGAGIFASSFITLRETLPVPVGAGTFTGYLPAALAEGVLKEGTGALSSRRATVSGIAVNGLVTSPTLASPRATIAGTVINVWYGTGALNSPNATINRAASEGTGALISGPATLWGGGINRGIVGPTQQIQFSGSQNTMILKGATFHVKLDGSAPEIV